LQWNKDINTLTGSAYMLSYDSLSKKITMNTNEVFDWQMVQCSK